MTGPVQFGQIVWAELADANGVRKLRPAVVLTPTDRVTPSGPLDVVAVTSRLPPSLPDDHVLLPWHAQGHPRTGLNRKCAAVCTWRADRCRRHPGRRRDRTGAGPARHSLSNRAAGGECERQLREGHSRNAPGPITIAPFPIGDILPRRCAGSARDRRCGSGSTLPPHRPAPAASARSGSIRPAAGACTLRSVGRSTRRSPPRRAAAAQAVAAPRTTASAGSPGTETPDRSRSHKRCTPSPRADGSPRRP